jgi:hypothetical protein
MKGTVLTLTCGACWHMKDSSSRLSLTRTSLQAISFLGMLDNYALPQLTNNGNTVLQLDSAPRYFIHTVRGCLNVNFPGRWTGREPNAWPPRSPDLTPLDFFLWGYTKDQVVQSKDEYAGWTQSMDHCSKCLCYTGHVTARLARGGL